MSIDIALRPLTRKRQNWGRFCFRPSPRFIRTENRTVPVSADLEVDGLRLNSFHRVYILRASPVILQVYFGRRTIMKPSHLIRTLSVISALSICAGGFA